MTEGTARTVIIFSIIAIILGGLTIGGVRILKARNDAYATQNNKTSSTPPVATSGNSQPPQSTPKKTATTNTPAPSSPSTTNPAQKPVSTPQPSPAVAAAPPVSSSSSNSTPAPTTSSTSSTSNSQGNLPNTSALSPGGTLATIVLVILAGIFSGQLLRARSTYRRYLS